MFKKLNEDAILPKAQTKYSAGYDVFANVDIKIEAGQTKIVPLGIALDVENIQDYQGKNLSSVYISLHLRSGFGAKGLVIPNGVGIIDIDYTKEIGQIIHNPLTDSAGYENVDFNIKKGDRVGQLIFNTHYGFDILGEDFRDVENERVGGFGSTNK